ncbi:MAG: tail fiber domain-containing protein, partial [Betaproteobacteria bacterium]|nr:tail fiber domain-containing protein [Betaproteobacteria bacterium]
LRTIKFSWKHDNNNKENLGLIAQDVEKVLPQVMDKNKIIGSNDDTEYLGVRYQEIVPVLVKAIQEQQQQIEELKAKLI